MLAYEVTVTFEDPDRAVEYDHWARQHHVPHVLATGCFVGADFSRASDTVFRTRYVAPDRTALDRYLADHAQRLRDDFARHFGPGSTVIREVWETVEGWTAAGPVAASGHRPQ